MAKSVHAQIEEILNKYIEDERETIEKIARETAEDTAKTLRKTSPRSNQAGKHYATGWAVYENKQAGRQIMTLVYNKNKPQLTHLLTAPHDIKNQYGEYGRSRPDPHLKNAEEEGIEKFLRRLEREL